MFQRLLGAFGAGNTGFRRSDQRIQFAGRVWSELVAQIRQDHPETILVLATTYGTAALEEQVCRLGIGYITKPFDISFLMQILYDLLQEKENREETEDAPPTLIPDPEKGNADML